MSSEFYNYKYLDGTYKYMINKLWEMYDVVEDIASQETLEKMIKYIERLIEVYIDSMDEETLFSNRFKQDYLRFAQGDVKIGDVIVTDWGYKAGEVDYIHEDGLITTVKGMEVNKEDTAAYLIIRQEE